MIPPKEPTVGAPHFLDTLSRQLATATSRRDAIRLTLAAVFGSAIASGCTSPTSPCGAGCTGSDGVCYSCSSGSYCSGSGGSGCSAGSAGGIHCCSGSSTGGGGSTCNCNPGNVYNYSSGRCCPNATPYYYPGTHGIYGVGCYASCPYVGDCGTTYQHC
jgi:hypothetical protein